MHKQNLFLQYELMNVINSLKMFGNIGIIRDKFYCNLEKGFNVYLVIKITTSQCKFNYKVHNYAVL